MEDELQMASYDILGNIAIIKKAGKSKKELKKEIKVLLSLGGVETILEKTDNVKGRSRTMKIKHLAGKKNTIAIYKETGCSFKMNIVSCYFSPRLASDRIYIAKLIKKAKAKKILCMFSGVAPYPIIIGKLARPKEILAIELGKDCCKYAEENVRKNKLEDIIKIVQGDVQRVIPKLKKKFDFIVMTRPNLKKNFLADALKVAKKGTRIYYHGFSHENHLQKMLDELLKEAKKFKRKIKITNVRKIGELAPYKYRYGIEISLEN